MSRRPHLHFGILTFSFSLRFQMDEALIGHHEAADPPDIVFPSDINRVLAFAAHQWIAGPTEETVRDLARQRNYH